MVERFRGYVGGNQKGTNSGNKAYYGFDPYASLEATARRIRTPFHYHIRRHDVLAARSELAGGANPFVRDECGRTALELAVQMYGDILKTCLSTSFCLDNTCSMSKMNFSRETLNSVDERMISRFNEHCRRLKALFGLIKDFKYYSSDLMIDSLNTAQPLFDHFPPPYMYLGLLQAFFLQYPRNPIGTTWDVFSPTDAMCLTRAIERQKKPGWQTITFMKKILESYYDILILYKENQEEVEHKEQIAKQQYQNDQEDQLDSALGEGGLLRGSVMLSEKISNDIKTEDDDEMSYLHNKLKLPTHEKNNTSNLLSKSAVRSYLSRKSPPPKLENYKSPIFQVSPETCEYLLHMAFVLRNYKFFHFLLNQPQCLTGKTLFNWDALICGLVDANDNDARFLTSLMKARLKKRVQKRFDS